MLLRADEGIQETSCQRPALPQAGVRRKAIGKMRLRKGTKHGQARLSSMLDLCAHKTTSATGPEAHISVVACQVSSAAHAVMHTPELLELILLYLSGPQLFAVQRVCKAFKAMTESSLVFQSKMLLRYPPRNNESEEDKLYDPVSTRLGLTMSEIWRGGSLTLDAVVKLSGLGAGGSARRDRCLLIKTACPLCLRNLDPKRRIRDLFHHQETEVLHEPPAASWQKVRLSSRETCTVSVLLRRSGSCPHYDVRDRLVEFPPGTGTLGDLADCLRWYDACNQAEREKENKCFRGKSVATYIWKNERAHCQPYGEMSLFGRRIAEEKRFPTHTMGCRFGLT